MADLTIYRTIIEQVLRQYTKVPYAYGDVESKLILDHENDNYLLLAIGWEGIKRVHGTVVHIEISDGKVWIQQDGTEEGVTDELLARGIPADQIVLGFHPAEYRQYTGLAVA